ncbi:Core-2/I-branching beta-1,6-N-acetylglucosaminyltransferase family protein [Striga asiatica]|uniref:Core-2/I-branching beta-1,6-N-acetylglucosaminyltransferase family protein n=1 Tax=Striga asiatica TaxID=4170 RepID=A0A5A7QLY2_STRAF|nr:Core-2/I-branching beta-1,6-N-acetylglucosaminyltransferase family protein [Striga asiatica]
MGKKAQAYSKLLRRHMLRLWWKLVVLASVALCVLAFFRIQQYSQPPASSYSQTHMSSQLMGVPKVAFLFLVRRSLPLDFLWESFFENVDRSMFSIYIHAEPGIVFDESTTRSGLFINRQLRNSIKVAWGEASMIAAERLLFEEALQDPANQRFVLLSDSCAPLYNFSYIYKYLMDSPRSFVDSFVDKKDVRYNPKMSPVIPRNKWRKGSQWVTLIRRHAEVVADDEIVFPIFKKFCKAATYDVLFLQRRPPVDPSLGIKNRILQKLHNCIPDEHYVQTLLAMNGLEAELERRTVTYTLWNQSRATPTDDVTWHPFTFSYGDSGPEQIKRIKDINHVNYQTEFRIEWCSNNSTLVHCFLFARKFSLGAAMRLLSQGLVGNLDVLALMEPPP